MIAKLDVGPKGALVTFAEGGFPDLGGLLGYIDRLKGTASFGPTASWSCPATGRRRKCGSTGALQLSTGLARVAAAGERSEGAGGGLGRVGLRHGDEAGKLGLISAPAPRKPW